MAISILTALFAISEQTGRWTPVYPVGTPTRSLGLVLFWWGAYAAGAWLSWLFQHLRPHSPPLQRRRD